MRKVSEDAFRQLLRPLIKAKIPFLAYWWEQGCGVIRLDEVQVPVIPPYEQRYGAPQFRPHTLSKRGRKQWEKNMACLRRQTWEPVVTVEFDGERATIEGGEFEL